MNIFLNMHTKYFVKKYIIATVGLTLSSVFDQEYLNSGNAMTKIICACFQSE